MARLLPFVGGWLNQLEDPFFSVQQKRFAQAEPQHFGAQMMRVNFLWLLMLIPVPSQGQLPPERKPVVGQQWKPVEKNHILPAKLKAQATYHFNRNALAATCIDGDSLLALTDSGNLLRFSVSDLQLQQEHCPTEPFTLLITAKGIGVLSACADGRVVRIDPKTLKQTEFAKLPAAPRWMAGFHDPVKKKDGVLAAICPNGQEIELHRLGFDQPGSEKFKIPVAIPRGRVNAFHLDAKLRLWLGKDGGEWGGWCGSIDLKGGKDARVEDLGDMGGIYGFVELPDGQVWAYGGMMHLGTSISFISSVEPKSKMRGFIGGDFFRKDRAGKPDEPQKEPRYPITHIMPDPKGDGLLVFSYRDLFQVDTKLTKWKHLGNVELRYRWGRPDAVGSYPALRTILAAGDQSADLICTTARDGLLRIKDGQTTQHIVPGQLGDDWISAILPAVGTSLLNGSQSWEHTGGAWKAISPLPPTPPGPDRSWYERHIVLDHDRRPVALCTSDSSRGTVAITRWKDSKVEVIATESRETLWGRGFFVTPDGGYWCADFGKLFGMVEGKWQEVGKLPERSDRLMAELRVVGDGKPPWLIHSEGGLFKLTPGKPGQNAQLTPIELPAELGKVHDALALESAQVLLACAVGLRLLDSERKISKPPFTSPEGSIRAICRDGRGRIWLAGTSVWMVDAKGTVHDLGKLAQYGVGATAIGADSTEPTGVIVSLAERGVLFVRAEDSDRASTK